MKQILKRSASWLLCLALLISLFAGLPGTAINHVHASEEVTDAPQEATNLLADYNASFEDYAIPNWTIETGVNQSRDQASEGNAWSLKISVKDASATSDSITVVPYYTYNATVKVLGAGKLTVIFYDADGEVLSETDVAESAAAGEWETLSVAANAPAAAAKAAVKLTATTAEAVYFDDASLAMGDIWAQPNLLNPSFENWAADGSKANHWIFLTGNGYASPEAEAVEGRGNVLTFNRDATKFQFYSEQFEVIGGKAYDISIDVNTSAEVAFYLYLHVFDAEGNQITSFGVPYTDAYEAYGKGLPTNEWSTINFNAALPQNAAKARLLVTSSGSTATAKMMFDNASAKLSNELCDGGFENVPSDKGVANGHYNRQDKLNTYINTDAAYVKDGTQSFASCGTTYWFYSNAINVIPGETYTTSFSMKSTEEYLSGATVKKPQYYMYFYDAAGNVVASKSNTGIVLTADWQDIVLTLKAPANAAYARMLLAPNGAVLYADSQTFINTTNIATSVSLTNGDFETAKVVDKSIVPQWVGSQYNGVPQNAMEVVYDAERGGNVVHIQGEGTQVWLGSKRFPAVPGEQYTASASFSGSAGYVQMYVRFAKTVDTGAATNSTNEPKRGFANTIDFTPETTEWVGISDNGALNLQGQQYIKDGKITLTVPQGANWVYVLMVFVPAKMDDSEVVRSDIYVDDVSLAKTADHTYTATVVEGSCTEDGYTKYDCLCGDSYVDESSRVVADGHDYQIVVTDVTCTTDGYTTYTCADCGDTYTGDTVTAPGHTPAEPVIENNVPVDCDTVGSFDTVVYCSVCGEELSRETTTVDAPGHVPGVAVIENNVASDCDNDGSYDTVVYCTVCGDELSRETTTVDAIGHAYTSEITKQPTLNEAGVETFTCSNCGDVYTKPIAMLGGAVADVDGYKYASVDEAIANAVPGQTVTLLANATITADATLAAGVTYEIPAGRKLTVAEGVTVTADAAATLNCAGTIVVAGKADISELIYGTTFGAKGGKLTIKATGTVIMIKAWEGIWMPTNDAQLGGMLKSCENGAYIEVGAQQWQMNKGWKHLNHTAAEPVEENHVASDCTNYGYYDVVVYCTDCGVKISSVRFYEKALGHKNLPEVAENVINPTCTAIGTYEAVTYCELCDAEVLRRLVEIPKLDHTYPETGVVTAPTCMKAGYTQYACVDCGYRCISDEVPAIGHAWTDDTDTTCNNGCGYIRTFHDGNLLNGYNPDFEDYTLADWTISDGVTQSRIADENLVTQSWCLRMAIKGSTAVSNSLPVLPGWPYTLNVKVLGEGELSIVFYDAQGNMIDRIANAANTTAWETIAIDGLVAPEKAHSAKIVLTATGDAPVYFDDAYMTSGEDVRLISVPNGDFENTDEPGWFYDSWYVNESGIVEMADGNHAFSVTTNDLPFQFKSAPFAVRSGKSYMATIDAILPEDGFLQVYVEYFHNDTQSASQHRLAATYRATDVVTEEGQWVEIAVLMDSEIPADATHARFLVKTSSNTSATFYFDNARVYQTDSLYNPGFEGTITSVGLPMGYTMSSENETTAAQYVNTDPQYAYEGNNSLHLTNDCWIYSHYINIHPGETYQSTFQIMTDVEWNREVDTHVVNRIYFYDADFKPIKQDTTNPDELAFISACSARIEPTGEWTPFTATAVAPDNAVYARVMVVSQRGTSCYLDNGVFEKAEDSNLIDHGDFEDITVKNHSVLNNWTGTQGQAQAEKYMETIYVPGQDKVAHINLYDDQLWIGSQRFAAIPGQKYTASALFSGTCGYVNVYVRFAATATSGEAVKSTQESTGFASTNVFTPESQGWIKLNSSNVKDKLGNLYIQNGEITLTVPKGANYVYVLIVGIPQKNAEGRSELDIYVDDVSLRKTAEHTYNPIVTDPTCTTAGYTTMVCDCGDEYILEGSEVPALGHTNGDVVVENNVAPDCVNTGSYDNVIYCTVCGAEVSRETITVDALGHTGGETTVENNVAPDCENNGSYDNVIYCTVCGEELSRENVTVPAIGHAYTSEITKQPTLNDEGIETFTCSNCGDTYTQPIAKLEGAVAEVDGYKYATLAEALLNVLPGETVTLLQSCEITEDTVLKAGVTYYIPADLTLTVAEGASVTADAAATLNCAGTIVVAGKADISALVYGTTFGKLGGNLTIKSTGSVTMLNSWENIWTPANDAQLGSMLLDCEAGAYVEIGAQQWQLAETWKHLNHVYTSEITTAPTCTAEGVKTYTCTVCGETYTETVAALGHTEGEAVVENNVAPDCTNTGSYDTVVYCTVCGEELSRETTTVAALGHTHGEQTDCTVAVNCSVCGEEIYAAKEHTYDNDQDATCNECGHERVILGANLKPWSPLGLSFPDYIGIQFLMRNEDIAMYDNVYLKAIQTTPEGVVETIISGMKFSSKYTLFDYPVMSWSMTEGVQLTLVGEKDGVIYEGETYNTSVMAIAMAKIPAYFEEGDMARVIALVDMLNYGAAVQVTYDHNATSLPNVDLGEFAQYGTTTIPTIDAANDITGDGTFKIINDNVSMQAKVELQLLVKASDLEGMTVKASLGETDVPVSFADYGSKYKIIRVAIGAIYLRDTVTIEIFDADGNLVSQTYNVSVEAYATEQLSGPHKDALIALMRFGDAVSKIK